MSLLNSFRWKDCKKGMNWLNWLDLGDYIDIIFNKLHSKKIKLSEKQRIKEIKNEFKNLIENVKKIEKNNAAKYIEKRNKIDNKLSKIQSEIKKELEIFMPNCIVYPSSSFTAGTHLIDKSNLDFNLLFNNLDENKLIEISNLCGLYNFKFIGIRSKYNKGMHYVFAKFINKIRIEIKIRVDKNYYMKNHYKIHNYIDNIMSKEDKNIITWIKYNLKNNSKKHFNNFKALYYEYASANAKVYKLLYPIE
jgi:hypothetical protein